MKHAGDAVDHSARSIRMPRLQSGWLPPLTLALAVGHLILLLCLTQPNVYFSGDAGLKALLARQEAQAGVLGIRPDLAISAPSWVHELWDQGLYPFGRPFVYEVGGRRFIQYPLVFPLLTAPFYALLGWPGFYVLPFLGVTGTLAAMLLICRHLGLGPRERSLSVLIAAFASPLAPYGAMFWEHAPALAAATLGGALVLHGDERAIGKPIIGGILAAFAGAMRPELLLFAAILGCSLVAWPLPAIGRRRAGIALAAGAFGAVTLPGVNLLTTGTPLGMHAQQMLPGIVPYLEPPLVRWRILLGLLVEWFPTAPLALGLWLVPPDGAIATARRLVATSVVFLIAVPFTLPSSGGLQWGPRFLLILVPVAAIGIATAAQALTASGSRRAISIAAALLIATIGQGAWKNAVGAISGLRDNYSFRVLPVMRFVKEQPERVVAVTHQWIAQDFADLIPERIFFRLQGLDLRPTLRDRDIQVTAPDDARRLARALHDHGIDGYFLIAYRSQPIPTQVVDGRLATQFIPAAINGEFAVFYAEIREQR